MREFDLIGDVISNISEAEYHAMWLEDIEFVVWEYGNGIESKTHHLGEYCKGIAAAVVEYGREKNVWAVWSDEEEKVVPVTIDEFLKMYEEWREG